MVQQKTTRSPDKVIDAISQFLNAPPEGIPAEIIEIFADIGSKEFLPPKLFLETVQQAPIAISITDPSACILYVNATFERLTGYTSDEVIGKNQSMLSSKSTPDGVYKDLWKTIHSRKVWKGMLVNLNKSKNAYLSELTISPVLDNEGEVAYFLGMHRDITEMHQLEQRLKFQQNLTEAALDAAPMVVAMMSDDRKVLMDNLAYKALMGDFRGKEPASLFLDALEKQMNQSVTALFKSGKGFTNIDVRLDPPSSASPRWFSCSGVHIEELNEAAQSYFSSSTKTRCYLLLIANEVTSSRERINEARMNMIRASMTEQQMSQTMREAISGAIYKLQVPLNVIKAALAIPSDKNDPKSLQSILRHALTSGEEAMDSLHSALPGPSSEGSTRVNVNELLHEVLKLSTDTLLSSGVIIDWQPTAVLPSLDGRTNALRGLFKYLLDNAIKAVNQTDQALREIRIQTRQEGNEVLVEIVDNGPGISDAHRLKVFEPFYCGWDQPIHHSGMGLTMSQEVVINHGGSIEIDAEFDDGCRVFVRLPVDRSE
jgi:nitrogen fixation negative regulator NifL